MATTTRPRPRTLAAPASVPARRFRPDIEGLRAIAVLFVVIWHANPELMPGGFVGVDVFFVISGFLMTQILMDSFEQRRKATLRDFYVRRAKRLLPAACLVLTVCAFLAWLILPPTRWMATGLDIVAAAGYVVNWRFADQAVNYLFADELPSVVLHFWSLAVEEQFYIFWPLALFAVYRISGSLKRRPETGVVSLAIGSFTVSLAWGVYLTATDAGRAYFVTTTRLWELMLGAIVALYAVQLECVTKRLAACLAWTGLAAILLSGVLLSDSTPFPGFAALLPTAGTAMIIAWGFRAAESGPGRILSVKPMLWIGGLSYSIYLWHWPFLVLAGAMFGGLTQTLSPAIGLAVVAVSVLPAWVSYRLVEGPMRRNLGTPPEKLDALQVGLVLMLVGALAGLSLALVAKSHMVFPAQNRSEAALPVTTATGVPAQTPSAPGKARKTQEQSAATEKSKAPKQIGARLLGDDPMSSAHATLVEAPNSVVPDPVKAVNDLPALYAQNCAAQYNESEPRSCLFGDPNGDIIVALVGDSHAAHWAPAFDSAGKERGWQILVYIKGSCPLLDVPVIYPLEKSAFTECTAWNQRIKEKLLADGPSKPDYLVVTSSLYVMSDNKESFDAALARTWRAYDSSGVNVVSLIDTPRPQFAVPACVSSHPTALGKCTFDRASALRYPSIVAQVQAAKKAGVSSLNLFNWFCPASKCPPVIGGVLVYRDDNHITATYATTLDYQLGKQLAAIIASHR